MSRPCSLRIGTLNINGALHLPEGHTIDVLTHLMNAANISILGVTDARIDLLHADSLKSLFRKSLPRGKAIIPFCTAKPYVAAHQNRTANFDQPSMGEVGGTPSHGSMRPCTRRWHPNHINSLYAIYHTGHGTSTGPHTMWERLVQFLSKSKNPLQPDKFALQTAERLVGW